ncbi:Hypothetical predicted protein [Marmota monax]|uniref:Uncharacterized protein n=1 Tax=Marmota monax TaxID=9995 RepID=A0A5E4B0F2_MARMO|nr:hypothetical protein GHT09_020473 [Marmota monax]VTJ62082.1 Hypothetical predicted protein [Marmota monax]
MERLISGPAAISVKEMTHRGQDDEGLTWRGSTWLHFKGDQIQTWEVPVETLMKAVPSFTLWAVSVYHRSRGRCLPPSQSLLEEHIPVARCI